MVLAVAAAASLRVASVTASTMALARDGDVDAGLKVNILVFDPDGDARCGRLSNTVPPGSTSLPKMPSVYIWMAIALWPATSAIRRCIVWHTRR